MATDNETLFNVVRFRVDCKTVSKIWVFRTRAAARQFANDKNKRSNCPHKVVPATWGPEQ